MRHLSYEETIRFHGHNGPFLALGYKAGSYAMDELKPEKLLNIECVIKTVVKKPYTCVIDGIQCSTHCTLGKGNLKLRDSLEERIEITFRSKEREIRFILKSYTLERALTSEDLEKDAEWINENSIESLFEIEEKHNL